MKKRILLASALILSIGAFAQKKELKEATKAIEKKNFAFAEQMLEQAKATALTDAKYATEYHYLKGNLYVEKAKANQSILASLQEASKALAEAEKAKSNKFSANITKARQEATEIANKQANRAYNAKNYKVAAPFFEQVYRFSVQDTVFLYNAAIMAVQAKEYDTALKYYTELKEIGFDGSTTLYFAKSKEGVEEQFPTKASRDLMLKSGYTSPREEKEPSKRSQIIKDIALIYLEQGKKDEAIQGFEDARKLYPNDANLLIQEAYVYYEMKNTAKFEELLVKAAELKPNDADIQYNIGVASLQQGKNEVARKYFEKTLALKSNYPQAALNLSMTHINDGNKLIEQMNKLGNSKADIAKYDQLKAEQEVLFNKAINVLEDYTKKHGNNSDILEQLKNIYGALGDTANAKRIRDLIK